jgi:uncharacterized membrane protein YphA (DoxX/SURF4 family)
MNTFSIDSILKQGRLLFAASLAALGVVNLACAHTTDVFLPVIPWVPASPWLGWLTGLSLILAGVSILVNIGARVAATFAGILFLLCDLALQISRVAASPWDVGVRTGAFETLILGCSALILAGTLRSDGRDLLPWERALNSLIFSARYLFAGSAIVFGLDHYLVFGLIVSLVPPWIPGGGVFWASFTAIAFIAAGLSIATGFLDKWAAAMMGLMFLLWFLVLHAPRVAGYPRSHDPDEWSSALIALGISGGSWILAASLSVNESRAVAIRPELVSSRVVGLEARSGDELRPESPRDGVRVARLRIGPVDFSDRR